MPAYGSGTLSQTADSSGLNSRDLGKEVDKWRDDYTKYMERRDGKPDTKDPAGTGRDCPLGVERKPADSDSE